MSDKNDLEGRQDMGGKHGGQKGMPKPEDRSGAQKGLAKETDAQTKSEELTATTREHK